MQHIWGITPNITPHSGKGVLLLRFPHVLDMRLMFQDCLRNSKNIKKRKSNGIHKHECGNLQTQQHSHVETCNTQLPFKAQKSTHNTTINDKHTKKHAQTWTHTNIQKHISQYEEAGGTLEGEGGGGGGGGAGGEERAGVAHE